MQFSQRKPCHNSEFLTGQQLPGQAAADQRRINTRDKLSTERWYVSSDGMASLTRLSCQNTAAPKPKNKTGYYHLNAKLQEVLYVSCQWAVWGIGSYRLPTLSRPWDRCHMQRCMNEVYVGLGLSSFTTTETLQRVKKWGSQKFLRNCGSAAGRATGADTLLREAWFCHLYKGVFHEWLNYSWVVLPFGSATQSIDSAKVTNDPWNPKSSFYFSINWDAGSRLHILPNKLKLYRKHIFLI